MIDFVTWFTFINNDVQKRCPIEMGQYRVQENQCIMPKVSQYHNTSLLFKVLMVSPESNDTILSRINPKYYHNVHLYKAFSQQKMSF